jgi:hypothetical protein
MSVTEVMSGRGGHLPAHRDAHVRKLGIERAVHVARMTIVRGLWRLWGRQVSEGTA